MEERWYIVALDVGGTEIKGAAVGATGRILEGTVTRWPAKSKSSKEAVLNNFLNIISSLISKVNRDCGKCRGICFAFPGPFDYRNGISYMHNIGKYDALFGVNVRKEIYDIIHARSDRFQHLEPELELFFENDARLFALGEFDFIKVHGYERAMFVTLGTGVGSAFIDHGKLVTDGPSVPSGGYIYNLAYKNSVIDECLSARGIIKIANSVGIHMTSLNVKALAEEARKGNLKALRVFEIYGAKLGDALFPLLERFDAQVLVLGGQISKSADLFVSQLATFLKSIKVMIAKDSSLSTFLGAYNLFLKESKSLKGEANGAP